MPSDPLVLGAFDVPVPDRVDEWQHRFLVHLGNAPTVNISGYKMDATTRPLIRINLLLPEDLQRHLWLLYTPHQQCLAFWDEVSELSDEVAAAVTHSGQEATRDLGVLDDFTWTALIGELPGAGMHGMLELDQAGCIGPFTLESIGIAMSEPGIATPGIPQLGVTSVEWSMPFRVRASHAGWSFQSASIAAAEDLARLSSLLSVAWGTRIAPRSSPQPAALGAPDPPATLFQDPLFADMAAPAPVLISIPDWADDAWERLVTKPWLAHAISAYREGDAASQQHPTLGYVGLTAAIESIAKRMFEEHKCDACDSYLNISAAFRAAVALVVEDEGDRLLVQKSYGARRSKAVHEGRLHSYELRAGSSWPGAWTVDPTHEFSVVLNRTRTAARELCLMALQNALPAKRALTEDELHVP